VVAADRFLRSAEDLQGLAGAQFDNRDRLAIAARGNGRLDRNDRLGSLEGRCKLWVVLILGMMDRNQIIGGDHPKAVGGFAGNVDNKADFAVWAAGGARAFAFVLEKVDIFGI
jgi:hypothetical protein